MRTGMSGPGTTWWSRALLSVRPNAGDIIRGSGGIRKIRWRSKGRGKRGGSRVIYYWLVSVILLLAMVTPLAASVISRGAVPGHIYLPTLYGKGVKDDLTPAERAAWRKVVEEIANG